MESPPKRMTRARAAAKASESTAKTTRIVTAAAKARTAGAATAGTKSTAAKRKARADENDNEDGHQEPTTRRAPRGRPRRGAGPDRAGAEPETDEALAPAPTKTARGRPTRHLAAASSKEGEAEIAAPARPRGRPRKTAAPETEEPAKKATRSRAATVTKPSTAGAKPAAKKTVKFQEPDKENVGPEPQAKEPASTGLRGRPARRRGAAAIGRATRTTATSRGAGQKKPLSPKKVTQMAVARDDDSSEDELAMDKVKTPVKPLAMSPIKPPASAMASAKKPAPAKSEADPVTVNTATLNIGALGASSLGSPPRRPPSSPLKDSMMKSPAKRMGAVTLPGSAVKPSAYGAEHPGPTPSFKTSLLQSATKRPQSPIRGLALPPASVGKPQQIKAAMLRSAMLHSPAKRAMPGFHPLTDPRPRGASSMTDTPKMQPLIMATPTAATAGRLSHKLMAEELTHEDLDTDELVSNPIKSPQFSGRLSAVMPRHVDPVFAAEMAVVDEDEEIQLVEEALESPQQVEQMAPPVAEQPGLESVCPVEAGDDDPMALEDLAAEMEESGELPSYEPEATAQPAAEHQNPMFQLRQKDTDPCHDLKWDSDSEDEPSCPRVVDMAHTPAPSTGACRGREGIDGLSKDSRRSTIGFTSLAEQFGLWSAASPDKTRGQVVAAPEAAEGPSHETLDEQKESAGGLGAGDSLVKTSFFEDEMLIHVDSVAETSGEKEVEEATLVDDIMVTDEDVALAQEANDMSTMEPQQIEAVVNGNAGDDDLSESSQEYGDENQMPVDPAMAGHAKMPETPVRPPVQHRSFFTTTKVPLKPADESTPSPFKKRSLSASRVTCRRPGTLSRSATVISYSPTKDKRRSSVARRAQDTPSAAATPSKTDMWSTMGTPARTPRRDLDRALLRGSVVLVDVHTTEGADASGIFIDLLNEMGARCVKTWHWSPSNPSDSESQPNEVGITHVVYKDGGKRTLEKVREANGVVHCVGVSWVLDCERENKWLDEAPYYIDTSHVPRGGARRRKSMEPKALANLNGTIVSGPAKASRAPNTPANRRDSTEWMHTPSDQGEHDGGDEKLEWSCVLLTPVPKTPAAESVARYAAGVPETPTGAGGDDDDDDDEDSSPTKQALMTRTCPPKRSQYRDMGSGILAREKDEQVLMRLMAARRKSLQFAPKIGSPLSKTWE